MSRLFAAPRGIRAFSIAFAASLAAALFAASPADARITRIEIDSARSQSPTFGGFSWPGVGQYEKIVGKAFARSTRTTGRTATSSTSNSPAQRARQRGVRLHFYILKPIDLKKGADKMMYEPPNRGGKTWTALGRVTVDPGANGDDRLVDHQSTVLANAFLMPRGYSIVWSGWRT